MAKKIKQSFNMDDIDIMGDALIDVEPQVLDKLKTGKDEIKEAVKKVPITRNGKETNL